MKEMFTYLVALFWFQFFLFLLRADFYFCFLVSALSDRLHPYARASARAYRMRARRQAETEQQDEPEERQKEIVYEVRENVDDLFEGYCEGTKIIVQFWKAMGRTNAKLSFERTKETTTVR